jgi:NADH-quinone oxidoreductase subunit H
VKETIIVATSNKILFIVSPILSLLISLILWSVVPFGKYKMGADLNIGILFVLALSSLGVYGIIMSGWSSNSKYAFLGGLRSAAQMVSYEVSMGLVILPVLLLAGSLNLASIVKAQTTIWFIVPLLPSFLMFYISALAETNRPPFDLPEAEAELVAGYSVEYSAMGFALFFIAEYANIIFMSFLTVILFFGGYRPCLPFAVFKVVFFCAMFVLVRAIVPRYRYDQLMFLCWNFLLPFSLAFVMFFYSILAITVV